MCPCLPIYHPGKLEIKIRKIESGDFFIGEKNCYSKENLHHKRIQGNNIRGHPHSVETHKRSDVEKTSRDWDSEVSAKATICSFSYITMK